MAFDIHKLDNVDPHETGVAKELEKYVIALMEQFFNSPEGKQMLTEKPGMGFWSAQLILRGLEYVGVTLPEMNVSSVHEIVTEIFPRKITIHSPDDANDTIPELISFWQFLKREYKLPNADSILKYLTEIEPDYNNIMNDPSKYGMAKSFMMQGKSAGFGMTNESDLLKYQIQYNDSLDSRLNDNSPEYPALSIARPTKNQKNKNKKTRKISKASRKKNKKRK